MSSKKQIARSWEFLASMHADNRLSLYSKLTIEERRYVHDLVVGYGYPVKIALQEAFIKGVPRRETVYDYRSGRSAWITTDKLGCIVEIPYEQWKVTR